MRSRAQAILILLLISAARGIEAQARTIWGVSAAGYGADSPYPSTGGLGVLYGIERQAGGVRLAGIVSVLKTTRTSDHIAICYRAPDDGCLPRPLFPLWLSAVELQAGIAPVPFLPLRLLGGAGISHAFDAREYWKGAPRTPNDAEWQSLWRGGVEVSLGRGPTAPRLQFTRTSFGAQPYSVTWIKSLTLVLVR